MKVSSLIVCLSALILSLSYVPVDAGIYKSKVRASCSGVSRSKVYSRGIHKVKTKRSCAG